MEGWIIFGMLVVVGMGIWIQIGIIRYAVKRAIQDVLKEYNRELQQLSRDLLRHS